MEYGLLIGVHRVCKLRVRSCKGWGTMTTTVHGHAIAYLQIDPACLKKGCLLLAQPLARARRFNTTQMAPACLFAAQEVIHLKPPALLPILAFPWPRDTGVTTPLGPCSNPLVPGSLGQEELLTRHEAKEQGHPFISPLLPGVSPELAVSCVPSARRLARLASGSTVGSNWKCMWLYNPFYWPLLSPGNIRMVVIHSVLLLHGKMDFLLPLIFSVLFLKKSKEIASVFEMYSTTIYFALVAYSAQMKSVKCRIAMKNPVDKDHVSSRCKLAKLCWTQKSHNSFCQLKIWPLEFPLLDPQWLMGKKKEISTRLQCPAVPVGGCTVILPISTPGKAAQTPDRHHRSKKMSLGHIREQNHKTVFWKDLWRLSGVVSGSKPG